MSESDFEPSGTIERLERAGRSQHPEIHVPSVVWKEFLSARLGESGSAGLSPDLYLACACIHRLKGAAELLAAIHQETLRETLKRALGDSALADDATQVTFQRVLSGKLEDYSGRGPLAHWLAVVGLRVGLEISGPEKARRVELEHALDVPAELSASNPAHQLDRRILREALERAVSSLTPKERTLLRLNFEEGLNISELGTMFSVHRATVARWIADAREKILTQTRAQLRLTITQSGEVDSLLRLADAKLELSLPTLLRSHEVG